MSLFTTSKRMSTRKSKALQQIQKQKPSGFQLTTITPLPQSLQTALALSSTQNLTFQKLFQLEFAPDPYFTDNILLMRMAVEAQQKTIEKLLNETANKVEMPTQYFKEKEEKQVERQSWRSRSRSERKDSDDMMTGARYAEILNPFLFEQKREEDFSLMQ